MTQKHGGCRGVTVSVACRNGRVACEGHAWCWHQAEPNMEGSVTRYTSVAGRDVSSFPQRNVCSVWHSVGLWPRFVFRNTWMRISRLCWFPDLDKPERDGPSVTAAIELLRKLFHNDVKTKTAFTKPHTSHWIWSFMSLHTQISKTPFIQEHKTETTFSHKRSHKTV